MSEGIAGNAKERISLPAILDIAAAAALKETLEAALVGGAGVEIEAGDVQRVTTPGLQVLAAAVKSFAGRGVDLRFGDCAPVLLDAIGTLALAPALGIHGD